MKNPVKDIDAYIASLPGESKVIIEKIRVTIRKAIPQAEEVISYGMPAFKYHGILIWFAAFKNHYSVFVYPRIKEGFKEEIKSYETTKSAIKFPLDKPVPVGLITKIVKESAKENLKKVQLKNKIKIIKK